MGAMYPAIDLAAGEKERGTLMTLLLVPTPRWKLVLGKLLVIFTMGVVAALLALVGLGGWLALQGGALDGALGEVLATIGVRDLSLVFLMLLQTALIFASLLLSISVYAKSFKEAQNYIAPLNLLILLPGSSRPCPGWSSTGPRRGSPSPTSSWSSRSSSRGRSSSRCSQARRSTPPGRWLPNITGASFGRVNVAPTPMDGARVNQHVCIIRPDQGLDSSFLRWYLASPSRQRLINGIESGATRQALTKEKILAFEVPLLPLSHQRAVVAEIEKQFSRLDKAVANLKRFKANLRRYKAAVLKAAVEGRLVPTEAELAGREGRAFQTGAELLLSILETRRATSRANGKYKEPPSRP